MNTLFRTLLIVSLCALHIPHVHAAATRPASTTIKVVIPGTAKLNQLISDATRIHPEFCRTTNIVSKLAGKTVMLNEIEACVDAAIREYLAERFKPTACHANKERATRELWHLRNFIITVIAVNSPEAIAFIEGR